MLNDGLLREFRDGSSRLLKVADLAGMIAASRPSTGGKRSARAQHKAGSPRPRHEDHMPASFDTEIKLPAAPTVTMEMSPPRAAAHKPAAASPRQCPARAVVISPPVTPQRPRPQMYEMSLRQWLWTGLLDDSPLAVFIVFGTVLLGAGAVAGAAYLLSRAL